MKEFGLLPRLHHSSDSSRVNSTPASVCWRETMNKPAGGGTYYTLQHGCVNIFWTQSTRFSSSRGKHIQCLQTDRQTDRACELIWNHFLINLHLMFQTFFFIAAINANYYINLRSFRQSCRSTESRWILTVMTHEMVSSHFMKIMQNQAQKWGTFDCKSCNNPTRSYCSWRNEGLTIQIICRCGDCDRRSCLSAMIQWYSIQSDMGFIITINYHSSWVAIN